MLQMAGRHYGIMVLWQKNVQKLFLGIFLKNG